MNNTPNLTEELTAAMSMNGEVTPLADMAGMVMDAQTAAGRDFTPGELYRAHLDAANQFIDSSVQNEHDTEESRFAESAEWHTKDTGEHSSVDIEREKAVARWEALRPVAVLAERLKAIDSLIN